MFKPDKAHLIGLLVAASIISSGTSPAAAAVHIDGQVQSGGGAVANSTVTLWAGSAGEPRQLAQAKTADDGSFALNADATPGPSVSLYLIAKGGVASVNKGAGDNPALAFLAVLGGSAPANVTVNEMTTIGSVWTDAQFLDGAALKGPALSLSIAAGNVAELRRSLNRRVGRAHPGCAQRRPDVDYGEFRHARRRAGGLRDAGHAHRLRNAFPGGEVAEGRRAERYPGRGRGHRPRSLVSPQQGLCAARLFLSGSVGKNLRPVPFMPYLNTAPSAWVLPLKFDGGGYRAGGKAAFDSEGNLWVGDNFTIGWQASDALWQGHATKFAPNGRPLSPITTGFSGGGMEGGTFGAAIDAKDNAWLTNYGSKSITVFDKTGKPLTPPEGITFGGRLGLMQGVIVTPSGDVWVLGVEKSQLVYFPKGDLTKGRIICEGDDAEPCKSFRAPFHLAIDQRDRIWVSNSGVDHVTRFPASEPDEG